MKIKNLLTVMTGLALFCLAGCASPQKEAVAKEYAPIEVAVPERPAGQQDVIQLTAPKLDTVRVGFIGLGMRGPGAVARWTHIPGTKIVALCDLRPKCVERAQGILEKAGLPKAAEYSGSEDAWKQLCERDDIDVVYIASDWKHHAEMGVYAMEHGKHVAIEVPSAMTLDVFALCFKSGNACILKGGSDADFSNRILVEIIRNTLLDVAHLSPYLVALLPAGHDSADALLHARGYVDLIIPRGGKGLIDYVRQNATIPVIETGAGVCHVYFDKEGDVAKGAAIIRNAKTRRVSVCNALDCLIIDVNRLTDLSTLCSGLQQDNVEIYADDLCYNYLKTSYPSHLLKHASTDTFGTEFLDYKMAVTATMTIQAAVAHISIYGSGHSECIVTENDWAADYFMKMVDAACVYVNVPTSFTDGGEFGLGAEIGISTQKLHARGPMGLEELNTYKWIIQGDGQIRQ